MGNLRLPVTADATVEWAEKKSDLLSIRRPNDNRDESRSERTLSAREWHRWRDTLHGEMTATRQVRPDGTGRRIRQLARDIGLSRTDVRIVEFALRYETQPLLESMVDETVASVGRRHYRKVLSVAHRLLPDLLGISAGACFGRLAANSPLVRTGLVSVDHDGDIKFIGRLKRLVHGAGGTELAPQRLLLDAAAAGELEWSDFDHIAHARDHVEGLFRGALQARAPGVNVLVYGPPGTGKTQFCRSLATRLGVTLYSVGESDEYGRESGRHERPQELKLAQRLLENSYNAILLFDEMEDLLVDPAVAGIMFSARSRRGRYGSGGSKVFMNRLLEQTAVPTLWTSNTARETCPTVLRRMI